MADSEVGAGSEKLEQIVAYMLDDKYHWSPVEHPPILGPEFPSFHEKMLAEFVGFNLSIRKKLESISIDDLGSNFDSQGVARSQELKNWQDKIRANLKLRYSSMPSMFTAGLGKTGQMASVDYWSKMSFLTIDEVLWLSVGLDPNATEELGREPLPGFEEIPPVVFLRRRREQLTRGIITRGYGQKFDGKTILDWVTRVGFDIHPRFRDVLRLMVAAILTADDETIVRSEVSNLATVQGPERRETKSLSTLILAMAIDHYGFDPDAGRSTVPKEIADLIAGLGLDLSQETVLKYLRMGRHYLPKDWKPVP